jgi:hypothetical protein
MKKYCAGHNGTFYSNCSGGRDWEDIVLRPPHAKKLVIPPTGRQRYHGLRLVPNKCERPYPKK